MRTFLIKDSNYKWWAFSALALGVFTSVADAGSVVVALPTIADHFGTDLPTSQWVVTAYALTISAFLLPMGRLSDMIGRKKVYILGQLLFVGGAFWATASTNFLLLVVPRVLMGIGAAMTQGTSMAMLVSAFSADERGKALGLQMGVVGAGGVGGPMLGGFIVGALGWRGVFLVIGALAAVATIAAQLIIRRQRSERSSHSSFDWLGAALSAGFLSLFLLAMSNGPKSGWSSPLVLTAMVGVAPLILAFVLWELRIKMPMFDLRFFRRRLFSLGVQASFLSFIGMSSVRFLMPFYLQSVLGYSSSQTGLLIVPAALTTVVVGPLGGRLSDRYGWRVFNVAGLMVSASGLFILSTVTRNTPLALVIGAMVIQSLGMGTFNAPNNSSILSTVRRESYGVVAAFLNVVRNSGNVTSIAVVTAVVTAAMVASGYPPTLAAVSSNGSEGILDAFTQGLRFAYMVTATFVSIAAVLSLVKGERKRQRDEEETGPAEMGTSV